MFIVNTGRRSAAINKNENDRTWCFWEKTEGFFEPIVFRSWKRLGVYGKTYSGEQSIEPYCYKMIRGVDFYAYCRRIINQHPSVTWLNATVSLVGTDSTGAAFAETSAGRFTAQYIFNSILFQPLAPKKGVHHLLQHFKGFTIRTAEPVFDAEFATLMDFRVKQTDGTSFVYVLPLSTSEALVEYTVFGKAVLDQAVYDQRLDQYISRIPGIHAYEVTDTEFGVIPMTTHRFERSNGQVINIGTAGGQTKASSGYTFRFIQKQSDEIVANLESGSFPVAARDRKQKKFDWYDATLLNILSNHRLPGSRVFTSLFRGNRMQEVFAFLDNETTLKQDLSIVRALPVFPFVRAAAAEARRAFF
ncbi:MAG: lycopene cyclase [Sphingobacteriales bacterium]|nr:MAG: lycopene cyclase [Sphingobacteriales bacterium]